jgi:N-methylhydantoinase A
MRIATDTGGTFTDCVFVRDGKLRVLKFPSQPKNPAAAIAAAVHEVHSHLSIGRAEPLDLVCGTTVGTNALLERRGGRVLLITTRGFEDVLEIARQARPKLYDLQFQKAEVLVPRELRLGAPERLAADGKILTALRPGTIRRLVRQARAAHADAIALCFLFSFRNPRHEAALARALRREGMLVSVSHEILPEFREFERTATTVINAYLAPVMGAYLRETELQAKNEWNAKRLPGTSKGVRVRVMQSNGGTVSAQRAATEPVRTVLSGPAGGVMGAKFVAGLAGVKKIITFDMGGTSTDVALLTGETRITTESRVAGLPVAVPMLEIHTVGAGGGSIARFDAGGSLRVGPQSAGADPGPICYGKGAQPTVTDAHAVLGHFADRGLLSGQFELQSDHARRAMHEQKGSFRSAEEFAQAILNVSNAVMERALRLISIEQGHDPREYTLVAFGGAGGLHACDLAKALEMRGVLIPVFPGALSALGILRANVVREFSQTMLLPVSSPERALRDSRNEIRRLQGSAEKFLRSEGFTGSSQKYEYRLDIRYVGQAYHLRVPCDSEFVNEFHRAHERSYGHSDSRRAIEIVNVRCRATGVSPAIALPKISKITSQKTSKPVDRVKCFFGPVQLSTALYARETLRAGAAFFGPAIISEYSATSLVPPGWNARVDDHGQIHLSQKSKKANRHEP